MGQQSRLPGEGPGYQSLNGGILAPPLPSTGHIPSVRLKSEIPDRIMEPPPCVQNAMMKQTKKPFTYTPGGLDLSEIKSPRMARRIERNANISGASEPPRPNPYQAPSGPLPPSALAAMQPQMHVQVFPSGPPPPPPGPRGGVPPPPPPPSRIPPPPPPPSQPLPTQKVVTGENQVLERPDMTKIIPDNPMSLLRKTGGVPEKKSFLDEVYQQSGQRAPQVAQRSTPSFVQHDQRSPPIQQSPKSPPIQQNQGVVLHQHPVSPPIQQQQKSPASQSNQTRWGPQQSPPLQQQVPNQWNKPAQNQQQWNQTVPSQSQRSPPAQIQQPWSPQPQNQRVQVSSPNVWSQPAEEVPRNQPRQDQNVKTSTAHLGSLYIPPLNQPQQELSRKSPPSPPQRNAQSPQSPPTPTLKEAPRPWQKQSKQQEELPPWAKREPVTPTQQLEQPNGQPNAVFVTQPIVLQHPGPLRQQPSQQPKPRVDPQGATIIPVQIEGGKNAAQNKFNQQSPVTPGNERSYNRQPSWSNTPAQSNAFKIIQKITQTDDDEEDENEPIIEHSPKYPQNFQQQNNDQTRKLKLTEGDRDLMNRFKQEEEDPRYRGGVIPSRIFRFIDECGVDDENSLHNEVDPRYRGPAIPSKAFKLLQSMTDGPSENPPVARGSPGRQPQVRTIPIQIERDDEPKKYVHPSEQTVPEPKKYTGSAIPSRSFKILQAMTAPDNCANANEVNENSSDPSSYGQWGYDPKYVPPVPFYWPDYYNCYYRPTPPPQNETNDKDVRRTPIPFWGYYPPYPPPPYLPPNEPENVLASGRQTPLPFWGYYPYYQEQDQNGVENEKQKVSPTPPPYQFWDPYYFYYPPVYSPYPFYGPSDTEDGFGYSSTDEMAYINRNKEQDKKVDSLQTQESNTPRIVITPTLSEQDEVCFEEVEDSETETEPSEVFQHYQVNTGLKSIKSVQNINVYDEDEAGEETSSDNEPFIEECSETTEENDDSSASSYIVEEDTIPHELSIIFEESEQTDRSKRECSVLSDSTTIKSSDEEELSTTVSIKLPNKPKTNEEIEICASFTVQRTSPNNQKDSPELKEITFDQKDQEELDETTNDNNENEEEEQDWWGILKTDEEEIPANRPKSTLGEPFEQPLEEPFEQPLEEPFEQPLEEPFEQPLEEPKVNLDENIEIEEPTSECDDDDDVSSASSSDSSSSESHDASITQEVEGMLPSSPKTENNAEQSLSENDLEDVSQKSLSIKDRIEALRSCIQQKKNLLTEIVETKTSVKEKVSVIEVTNGQQLKAASTKSSLKSLEEFSEEEGDSGVTSDMSRQDTEDFPELRKMSRYQRAQTHSRLYKLLQEGCDEDEEETDKPEESTIRRDQLTLPLKTEQTSSQVDEKLVTELVESMLIRKQGQVFRDISKDKIQAAARRILQEENDTLSTPDSCFLSPMRNSTESSTPAQTPQEFYDYKQYYDSWKDSDRSYYEDYDILPSKAFKLLQEHAGSNRTGAIAGLLAKCPKVLSSKNIHLELAKLLECSESPSPSPDKSFEPNEVSSAS